MRFSTLPRQTNFLLMPLTKSWKKKNETEITSQHTIILLHSPRRDFYNHNCAPLYTSNWFSRSVRLSALLLCFGFYAIFRFLYHSPTGAREPFKPNQLTQRMFPVCLTFYDRRNKFTEHQLSILLFRDKSATDWDRWNDQIFELLFRNIKSFKLGKKKTRKNGEINNLSFAEHAFKSIVLRCVRQPEIRLRWAFFIIVAKREIDWFQIFRFTYI